jgi:hypothetical protein
MSHAFKCELEMRILRNKYTSSVYVLLQKERYTESAVTIINLETTEKMSSVIAWGGGGGGAERLSTL